LTGRNKPDEATRPGLAVGAAAAGPAAAPGVIAIGQRLGLAELATIDRHFPAV
jgi:hypothetical protein